MAQEATAALGRRSRVPGVPGVPVEMVVMPERVITLLAVTAELEAVVQWVAMVEMAGVEQTAVTMGCLVARVVMEDPVQGEQEATGELVEMAGTAMEQTAMMVAMVAQVV